MRKRRRMRDKNKKKKKKNNKIIQKFMQENITKELIIFSILASPFKVAKAPRETSMDGGRGEQRAGGVTLTAATEP